MAMRKCAKSGETHTPQSSLGGVKTATAREGTQGIGKRAGLVNGRQAKYRKKHMEQL